MQEFAVGGKNYRADKLDAFQQWEVARRLLSSLMDAAKVGGVPTEIFMRAFSTMKGDDDRVVRLTCLGAVSREDRGGFARLLTPQGQLMYDDLKWSDVLEIVQNVVEAQIFPFSGGPARASSDERPASESSSSPPNAPGSSVR